MHRRAISIHNNKRQENIYQAFFFFDLLEYKTGKLSILYTLWLLSFYEMRER